MNSKSARNSSDGSTVSQCLEFARTKLTNGGMAGAARESRMLVCHVLNISMVELIGNASDIVGFSEMAALNSKLVRRLAGEPIGRITGFTEFYGLPFKLSPAVLIPRADSETLVNAVLSDLKDKQEHPIKLLEMGTGSGILIVSLLHHLKQAEGIATDISKDALNIARENSRINGVAKRVNFVETSWCDGIEGKFDILVSNPPYIKSGVIPELAIEVKAHDPLIALDGGGDGLDAYRAIFTQSSSKMSDSGKLYLEIGFDQVLSVGQLAQEYGWQLARSETDLAGQERVLIFNIP